MFHRTKKGAAADDDTEALEAPSPVAGVERPWEVPGSLRRVGLASWLFVGVVAAVGVVVAGLVVTAGIVVPLLFAFYFGAVIFPAVDWLERHRVPRAAGALLIVVLAILGMVAAAWIVIVGILDQVPSISANLDAATKEIQSWLTAHNVSMPSTDQIKEDAKTVASNLSGGVLTAIANGLSSLGQLLFGIFIGLNVLFWVEKDGRKIGRWAAGHVGVPGDVALPILRRSVRTLQRYFYGVTIIAALNGVIVAGGALIIGTPMALTIGLVTFLFAYIPYFGAIIGVPMMRAPPATITPLSAAMIVTP